MVSTNHDWPLQLTLAHHFVEAQAKSVTLAVTQPTNARWQTLEGNTFLSQLDPLMQAVVIGEFLKHCSVCCCNVGRIARECNPTEWALAFAKQWSNVRRQKAWVVECSVVSAKLRFSSKRVAIIEHFCAGIHKANHRLAVCGHCCSRTTNVLGGICLQHCLRRIFAEIVWQVRKRVVRARLVGHDVGSETHLQQFWKHVCSIANYTNRKPALFGLRLFAPCNCVFKRVGNFVQVSGFYSAINTPSIYIDTQCNAVVHRHGKRLCAAHAAKARRQRDGACERAIKFASGNFGEALVRSLQNSLSANVNPRTCRHLAIHREARGL